MNEDELRRSTGRIAVNERLYLPDHVKAILWDMDGVLLDTLGLDVTLCNELVRQYFGNHVSLPTNFIRSIFAYHPPEFWQRIFQFIETQYGVSNTQPFYDTALETYNRIRNASVFQCNPGIREILEAVKRSSLKQAVVSNNPTEDVRMILSQAGILEYFDAVVGNDIRELKKKPEPDTYRFGAERLGVRAEDCVVVEDSLLGAEAGFRAGGFVVGVATGSADFSELSESKWTHQTYSSFESNHLKLRFGTVTKKTIVTPNEFVSHAIEHIAWRLGTEIDLYWNNNDWRLLGQFIGRHICWFDIQATSAAALGMIDDGSAEVRIDLNGRPELRIDSVPSLDLNWFLSLRCEQLHSGDPLKRLLQGLTDGLNASVRIRIWGMEDPHHAWEGVFRSVGIALSKLFTPKAVPPTDDALPETVHSQGDIQVKSRSVLSAQVHRKTAESSVTVSADFSQQQPNRFHIQVSPSVRVSRMGDLMTLLADAAGLTLQVDYRATVLSSSHVVWEDTGLVLGRALKEIMVMRMTAFGVNGAGSSLNTPDDIDSQPIRVGVSVEGRKFWKFIPFDQTVNEIRSRFLIGQLVFNELYSEDLDDFLDGLSGGLGCSIVVHINNRIAPDEGWRMVFAHLGNALKEAFDVNPYRKGVPPGVKATLS